MECTWATSSTATRWVQQHARECLRITAAQDAMLWRRQEGNSEGAKGSQLNLVAEQRAEANLHFGEAFPHAAGP